MVNLAKKLHNKTRQSFLLTFFTPENTYQELEVNGFYLVKQFNGNTKDWQVAIFTKEAFLNRKSFLSKNGDQAKALTPSETETL